jgi:hypothetical protein
MITSLGVSMHLAASNQNLLVLMKNAKQKLQITSEEIK